MRIVAAAGYRNRLMHLGMPARTSAARRAFCRRLEQGGRPGRGGLFADTRGVWRADRTAPTIGAVHDDVWRLPAWARRELPPPGAPRSWWWRRPLAIALAGVAILFVAGLLVSLTIDMGGTYLRSPLVYVGSFGVAWELFWYVWSVSNIPTMLAASAPAFAVDRATFEREWRAWVDDLTTAPVVVFVGVAVYIVTYVILSTHVRAPLVGIPNLGEAWTTQPNLLLKNGIVLLWGVPALLILAANVVGACKYFRLTFAVGRGRGVGGREPLELVRSAPVAREGLRWVAVFGLVAGTAWTAAGTIVAGAIAAESFRVRELVVVLLAGSVGFLLLVLPQVFLRRALVQVRDDVALRYMHAVRAHLPWNERTPASDERLRGYEGHLLDLQRESVWPHGATISMLAVTLAPFLLPAAALALRTVTA